jgi:hypothetical protein
MSAKQFREYADECMSWAKTAASDKDRQNYLQMAEVWLRAVAQYEKGRPSRKRSEALDRPPMPPDTAH